MPPSNDLLTGTALNHNLRFLKFGLVGVTNTAFDFAIFVLLLQFFSWGMIAANAAAYLFAVTNSFLLNRIWTFGDVAVKELSLLSYARFVVINSFGLFIGTGLIYLLSSLVPIVLAKLMSAPIVLIWNYLGARYFVFNEGK